MAHRSSVPRIIFGALGGTLPPAYPVGACVTSPELGDVLQAGDHGSTFAGGPVVARAALAAFDVLDDGDLLRRVRELGRGSARGSSSWRASPVPGGGA